MITSELCSNQLSCDIDICAFVLYLNKRFDYFTGETLQMVDLMLWPWFERFLIMAKINPQMVSLEDFPLLRQWTGVMSESPAVVKCRLPLEQFLGFAKSAKMGAPNYDIGLEQDS